MSESNTQSSEMSFEDLLEQSFSQEEGLRDGETVDGTVVAVQRDQVIVDVGFKSEGFVPIDEFPKVDGKPQIAEGDRIRVVVESKEADESGLCRLSKRKADRQRNWGQILGAFEAGTAIEGTVLKRVKGGLQVDIGLNTPAFLPGSQVALRPERNLDKFLGERLRFKILSCDQNRNRTNVVVSRRELLDEERKAKRAETLARLQEGAILDGSVKNITEYGAFVDLGGIDGLLHITDMSWGRINHPQEMVAVGEDLRVKVLKFDPNTERVSLGLKQIQDDPWMDADAKYTVGKRVSGKVVSLTDYGLFVELEPGIEGLVHITEMSWTKRVKHPSKLYSIGDEVEAIVLDIDISQKRISLGIKQTEPNPWTMLAKKYPVGTVLQGPVRNITDFGIFVGVEEGIDGLVHISDLSWSGRIQHPSELYRTDVEVEAVVLNIDVENERFSLGIKQLADDPWRAMPDHLQPGSQIDARVLHPGADRTYVELEPGIEGLLTPPDENLKPGSPIEVRVQDVDMQARRIIVAAES